MSKRSARTNRLLAAALVLVTAGTVLAAVLSLPRLSSTQVVYVDTDSRTYAVSEDSAFFTASLSTTTAGFSVSAAPSSPVTTASPATTVAASSSALRININTASLDDLMQLKGIGAVLAGRIIDYREEHGAFGSVEELTEVRGIGDKTLDAIRDTVTIG